MTPMNMMTALRYNPSTKLLTTLQESPAFDK